MSVRLTINVDVDGVLYDFNEAMRSYGESELGRKLPASTQWEMWKDWDVTRQVWHKLFTMAIMDGEVFRNGAAIAGAQDGVKRLIDRGHRVRLVTSKNLPQAEVTRAAQIQCIRWLEEFGILQFVELVFTNDKQGYSADVVIDDKPSLRWVQKGATNILFEQPWNADAMREGMYLPDPLVVRAWDWPHVVRLVETAANPMSMEELDDLVNGGAGGF